MTLANKYRLCAILFVSCFFASGLILEYGKIPAGYVILGIFVVMFTLMGFGIYWLSQKCPHCHKLIYDRSKDDENNNLQFFPNKDENSIFSLFGTAPFSYLMFTGKCHHCQKRI